MCAAAAVEQREYLKCWASIVCTAAAAAIGAAAAAFRGYNIVAHFTLGYVERRNLPATMAALPPLTASRSERASAHHNYLLAGCNFSPFSQVHCCEISARLLSRRQQQPPQPTASYLLAYCFFFLPRSACPVARLEFRTVVSTERSMVRAPPQEMKITFPEVQYSGGRTSPVNFVFSCDFATFYISL
jgi:hypothetical protein